MTRRVITCQDCIEKAREFLVPENKDWNSIKWQKQNETTCKFHVLARDTGSTVVRNWRQEILGKKVAIWKPEHELKVYGIPPYEIWDLTDKDINCHLIINNPSHKRSKRIFFCQAPEQIMLCGPGAQKHMEEDMAQIQNELEETQKKLEEEQEKKRQDQLAKQRFENAQKELAELGIEIKALTVPFYETTHKTAVLDIETLEKIANLLVIRKDK